MPLILCVMQPKNVLSSDSGRKNRESVANGASRIFGQGERLFREVAEAIASKYQYSASWTRKQLRILGKKGVIETRKRAPGGYIYFMKKPVQSAR